MKGYRIIHFQECILVLYSYLKEIIHGQSHATLSNEERDALEMALNYNIDAAKLEEKQAQQATLVQQDTNETKN